MNSLIAQGRVWLNRRLERRITAYSVAVILSISLFFGALSLAASLWLIKQQRDIELEHRLDQITALLDGKADILVRHTQDLSRNPTVVNALLDSKGRDIYLSPFFANYRFPFTEPHSIALCDFAGKLMIQQKWHPVGCLTGWPQSHAVIDAEQQQAVILTIAGHPHLALFEPVLYPGGRAEGYLLTTVNLQAMVAEKSLAEPEAILILHSPGGTLDFAIQAGAPAPLKSPTPLPTRPLFAAGPFAAAGLTLALDEPESHGLLPGMASLLLGYGLGTLALVALALLLSYRLARRLAEPLRDLNRIARRIAAEGPSAGLAIRYGSDEVGELAVSFNQMVTALRQAQQGLEAQVQARTEELQQALAEVARSEELQRAILDSVASYITVLDRDGVIVAVNEPWRRFVLEYMAEFPEIACCAEIGSNYLTFCRKRLGGFLTEDQAIHDGIQALLLGQRSTFTLEYAFDSPGGNRWFNMVATLLGTGGQGVVIARVDITERKRAEHDLRRSLAAVRRHDAQMIVLNQMNDRLLACETGRDAYNIIADSAGRLFASGHGYLFIAQEEMVGLQAVAFWGKPPSQRMTVARCDCRALQRGELHEVIHPSPDRSCPHFPGSAECAYFCIPLMVRSQIVGLLQISTGGRLPEDQFREWRNLTITFSESVKLALLNLRLQEALREQAIRDPLTGLFNRRYLNETLPRELQRRQRSGEPLTVAMLDLDHFKRFNDNYGHEAGDAVLQMVGQLFRRSVRGSDIACRYGGEELALILPGATPADARTRLEDLRRAVMQLHLSYRGGDLPAITVSIGLTAAKPDEVDAAALLGRADAALYQAKQQGRNRVVAIETDAGAE